MVIVPDVRGQPFSPELVRRLRERGLLADTGTAGSRPAYLGVVVDQKPDSGMRVPAGSRITLFLGNGRLNELPIPSLQPQSTTVRVPRLVGLDAAEAGRELSAAGLRGRRELVHSDVQPVGLVASSDPVAGTPVPRGATVMVRFSTGPGDDVFEYRMPYLVGLDTFQVRRIVDSLRLVASIERRPMRGGQARVVAQRPDSGTPIHARHEIGVLVEVPLDPVRVPYVVGDSLPGAAGELKRAGLALGAVTPESRRDLPRGVVAQSPDSGRMVQPLTPVRLTVNTPPPALRVTVPFVVDLDRQAAESRIAARGLQARAVATESGAPGEAVYRQSPDSGVTVDSGTVVAIWTRRRPPPLPPSVEVPQLRGRTRSASEATLRAAWLAPRLDASTASGAEEFVYWQSPDSGVRVDSGSYVRIATERRREDPPPTTRVPWIVGEERAAAERMLADRRLTPRPGSDPAMRGRELVIGQAPDSGRLVPVGTPVDFTTEVEEGTETDPPPERLVEVPDVVGLDARTALHSLDSAGLGRRLVAYEGALPASDTASIRAIIIDQRPRGREVVDAGTTVDLTIRIQGQAIVPDLRRMRYLVALDSAARTPVVARALDPGIFASWRRVASQVPVAGEAVGATTIVELELGLPVVPISLGGTVLLVGATGFLRREGLWPWRRPRVQITVPKTSIEVKRPVGGTVVETFLEVRFAVKVDTPLLRCDEQSVLKAQYWRENG